MSSDVKETVLKQLKDALKQKSREQNQYFEDCTDEKLQSKSNGKTQPFKNLA